MKKTQTEERKNTVYVFIDASNVWNAVKSVKRFIEYNKIKDYFKNNFNEKEVEVFYYDAYPKDGTRNYDTNGKHKFYTYLKKGLDFPSPCPETPNHSSCI